MTHVARGQVSGSPVCAGDMAGDGVMPILPSPISQEPYVSDTRVTLASLPFVLRGLLHCCRIGEHRISGKRHDQNDTAAEPA